MSHSRQAVGPGEARIADAAAGAEIDYVVCDVFTPRGLAGNQLAVFPHADSLPDGLRAALTREMNYSESVFVTRPDARSDPRLSIYTPAREIPFAGHPVLGAAAVLTETLGPEFRLGTRVGSVTVEARGAGPGRFEVWMQQPWPETFGVDLDRLRTGLGLTAPVAVTGYDNGGRFALVEFGSRAEVGELRPDLNLIAQCDYGVLCFAGEGMSFKARMFAPSIGVPEDPATGSAAGPLAVHLYRNGRLAPGQVIEIEQGAEIRRPSLLRAMVDGAGGHEPRVRVGGHVVVVAQGAFSLRRQDMDAFET